jgi:hypothetical protein
VEERWKRSGILFFGDFCGLDKWNGAPLMKTGLPSFTFLIHQAEPCGGAAEGGAEYQSHAGGAQGAAPRGGHTQQVMYTTLHKRARKKSFWAHKNVDIFRYWKKKNFCSSKI